MLYVKGCIKE